MRPLFRRRNQTGAKSERYQALGRPKKYGPGLGKTRAIILTKLRRLTFRRSLAAFIRGVVFQVLVTLDAAELHLLIRVAV